MRNNVPMNINSTPLLTYNDLQNLTTDLVSDAFGIDAALSAILPSPEDTMESPSEKVLESLFDKINHNTKVH
jgi:hypothetical protein